MQRRNLLKKHLKGLGKLRSLTRDNLFVQIFDASLCSYEYEYELRLRVLRLTVESANSVSQEGEIHPLTHFYGLFFSNWTRRYFCPVTFNNLLI